MEYNNATPITNHTEHIRKRPGMYIGGTKITGFKCLLQYFLVAIIKNGLEDLIIEIGFHPSNKLKLKIKNIDTSTLIERLSKLNRSETYDLEFNCFIALSSEISITIHDIPGVVMFYGKQGICDPVASTSQEKEKSVLIDYQLDNSIFQDFNISYEQINYTLRQFSLLNPGLKIVSTDNASIDFQQNVYYFPEGFKQEVDYILSTYPYADHFLRIDKRERIDNYEYNISMCYGVYLRDSVIRSFAGTQELFFGGSLEDGIFDGLMFALKELAEQKNEPVRLTRRLIKKNIIVLASVQGPDYTYLGSTRWKLGMPNIRKAAKELIIKHLKKHPDMTLNLLYRFSND
ncbi:MAG TPA: hypothetical protein VK154_13305 [Chitinophagales bacterium]|nr:hypothetical protein [Chitinophagales bacterium]